MQHIIIKRIDCLDDDVFESQREGGTLHLAYQTQTPEPSTSVATTPLGYAPRKRQATLVAPKRGGGVIHLAAPLKQRKRDMLMAAWRHGGPPVMDTDDESDDNVNDLFDV